jgi:hypothetical protein
LQLGAGGTVVHVLPGTYSGSITTNKSGTASARIMYVSDTQYGARLTGSGSGSILWTAHGAYTDIVGFEFDGSVNGNLEAAVGTYSADGTLNVGIKNNKIHDLSYSGNHGGSISVIASCIITTTYPTMPCNTIIEGNFLYHNNGGAAMPVTVSNPNNGIDGGWGDIIRNNIVVDQGGGRCAQIWHSSNADIVTNNTFVNCAEGGILVGRGNSQVNDYTTVSNNIIAHTGFNCGPSGCNAGIYTYSTGACGAHNIYPNNLLYGNGVAGSFDWGSVPCANTSSGTQTGSDSITFVNYTGTVSGDYHLKAGSTGIDKGTTACALTGCVPSTDFDGISRPQGAAYDIGAYEWH